MSDDAATRTLNLARLRAHNQYRAYRETCAEVERLERAAGIRACEAGSVRVREDDGAVEEELSLEGAFRAPGDDRP